MTDVSEEIKNCPDRKAGHGISTPYCKRGSDRNKRLLCIPSQCHRGLK
jgi:hypothetical protein